MSCKATVHQAGNVAVIDLSGRVTLGEGCALVRSTVQEQLQQGHVKILLNLGEVTYMDSAGLGELVGSYASVTNKGGKIKLLNAQGKVAEVLNVTKLYTVFETFTDEATALRSF